MPAKKSELSVVTLVRPLIVSGMLVYYVNSKLPVSLGNFLNGSKYKRGQRSGIDIIKHHN